MAISRARKEELLAQYTTLIEESEAMFLAEYKGMTVKNMESLRTEVAKAEGAFFVTKNTLMQRAMQNAELTVPDDFLLGQLATGFALGEIPTMAKALVDYAKSEDNLTLKGGFLGEKFLTPDEIEALAKLPSLDELRSQILGLFNAPAQNIASTVSNGVRQLVNVFDAYAKSEEQAADAA